MGPLGEQKPLPNTMVSLDTETFQKCGFWNPACLDQGNLSDSARVSKAKSIRDRWMSWPQSSHAFMENGGFRLAKIRKKPFSDSRSGLPRTLTLNTSPLGSIQEWFPVAELSQRRTGFEVFSYFLYEHQFSRLTETLPLLFTMILIPLILT